MSTVSDGIKKDLVYRLQNDSQLRSIVKKIRAGDGDYTDAEKYASRAGQLLTEVFQKNITADNFPVGSVKELASMIIPAMETNHDAVTQVTGLVQKSLNKAGNIGMNSVTPRFNKTEAYNLVGRMANYESFDDAEWMFGDPVQNAALKITDDTLKSNADFQYKSGLRPKIVRTCESNACEWCQMLEGEYDYEEVKDRGDPVYQRHNNCACEISYEPGDGRVQDVYSKQWYDEEKAAHRINQSLMVSKKSTDYLSNLKEPRTTTEETKIIPFRFNKLGSFRTASDPALDYFGKGLDSNPEEIEQFKNECKNLGVEVIVRDSEVLGYEPSPVVGKPGQIIVWDGASFSAWKHEMQHLKDDLENGWDGARAVWDPDEHYRREQRAYQVEIDYAQQHGAIDLVEELKHNLEEERKRIYGN